MRELLHIGAYNSFVQSTLVQAQVCYCDQLNMIWTTTSQNHVFFQYWHDPIKMDEYVAKSQFIGEINNEGPNKDPSFAENLNKLENFVMVKNTEVFSKIDLQVLKKCFLKFI